MQNITTSPLFSGQESVFVQVIVEHFVDHEGGRSPVKVLLRSYVWYVGGSFYGMNRPSSAHRLCVHAGVYEGTHELGKDKQASTLSVALRAGLLTRRRVLPVTFLEVTLNFFTHPLSLLFVSAEAGACGQDELEPLGNHSRLRRIHNRR